jgi:hypothetical protein
MYSEIKTLLKNELLSHNIVYLIKWYYVEIYDKQLTLSIQDNNIFNDLFNKILNVGVVLSNNKNKIKKITKKENDFIISTTNTLFLNSTSVVYLNENDIPLIKFKLQSTEDNEFKFYLLDTEEEFDITFDNEFKESILKVISNYNFMNIKNEYNEYNKYLSDEDLFYIFHNINIVWFYYNEESETSKTLINTLIECLIILLNKHQHIQINNYLGCGYYNITFDINLIQLDNSNINVILRCSYRSLDKSYYLKDISEKTPYHDCYDILKKLYNDKDSKVFLPKIYDSSINYEHKFNEPLNTYWWFICEKLQPINCKKLIKEDLLNFVKQMLKMYKVIKQQGYYYTDLKYDNVMFSNLSNSYILPDFEGYKPFTSESELYEMIWMSLIELCSYILHEYTKKRFSSARLIINTLKTISEEHDFKISYIEELETILKALENNYNISVNNKRGKYIDVLNKWV